MQAREEHERAAEGGQGVPRRGALPLGVVHAHRFDHRPLLWQRIWRAGDGCERLQASGGGDGGQRHAGHRQSPLPLLPKRALSPSGCAVPRHDPRAHRQAVLLLARGEQHHLQAPEQSRSRQHEPADPVQLLDYDAARFKARKLSDKPSDDTSKLPRVRPPLRPAPGHADPARPRQSRTRRA